MAATAAEDRATGPEPSPAGGARADSRALRVRTSDKRRARAAAAGASRPRVTARRGRAQPAPDDEAAPAYPDALIDINDLTDLGYIRVEGAEIAIGAMTRHAELLDSAVLGEHYPIFHDAEQVIADPIVRNRGTIGGSLCQADPSEDLSAVCRGARRDRWCCARPRAAGPFRPASSTSARTRRPSGRARCSPRSGSRSGRAPAARTRRSSGARVTGPSLPAGAFVRLDGETVADVGHRAHRGGRAALLRAGGRGEPARQGADRARTSRLRPRWPAPHRSRQADQRGPVDYKRHLAGELILRALRRAAARARGGRES